jgi:hypothetical protein
VVLLVDLLRVWLPSIITIFGQAASTPAELLGAFALMWFVLAFLAPPLARVAGASRVGVVAAWCWAAAGWRWWSRPGRRSCTWRVRAAGRAVLAGHARDAGRSPRLVAYGWRGGRRARRGRHVRLDLERHVGGGRGRRVRGRVRGARVRR